MKHSEKEHHSEKMPKAKEHHMKKKITAGKAGVKHGMKTPMGHKGK